MHGRKPALSDGSDFGMGDDEMDWGEEETDDDIMQDEVRSFLDHSALVPQHLSKTWLLI